MMEVLHCSSLRWSTKASMATLVLSPMRSPHRESNPLVPRYATERTLRFAYLEQAVGNVAGNAGKLSDENCDEQVAVRKNVR